MALVNLFDPPQKFGLPLTRKRDLLVDFIYRPLVVDVDGVPVLLNGQRQYVIANYPAGAAVKLEIDAVVTDAAAVAEATADPLVEITPTQVIVTAVITNHHAEAHADYLVANPIPKSAPWRARITYTTGIDDILCEGLTTRPGPKGAE